MKGVVIKFDPDRGFGFVRVNGQPRDVFAHVTEIPGRQPLDIGQMVSFDLVQTERGPQAHNIVLDRKQVSPEASLTFVGLTIVALLTLVAVAAFSWSGLVSWLVAVNVLACVIYGWDKHSARRDMFRIPEVTLHLVSALGGTPGAFAGQRLFHHKTRKASFQLAFWIIAAIQALTLVGFILSR